LKKQLLSTSAIALGVAMASPAAAQQWNLDWGGFANTHVGISDVDVGNNTALGGTNPDFDGVNVFTNSELIFSPSVTLDNGMTFGFSVQMEALNGGGGADGIDESYVTISSDMLGKIVLGSENSAGYLSMVAAPQVGSMPINSRSISAFVPITQSTGFRQAALSSYTEVAGNNDVQRITYFTPSFNGLTVGVSYAPSSAGNASNNAPVNFNSAADITDIFDIGINYSQSFNTVDVAFGARWGTGSANVAGVDDPETWGVGGSLTTAGFTFGVGYSVNDNVGDRQTVANGGIAGSGDQEGWSFGVAYDLAGPWTVGLEGYYGEEDTQGSDAKFEAYKLAGSRELGSGVSWDVYYSYVSSQADTGGEVDGNVIATAINLSF
jgi:predicted porin